MSGQDPVKGYEKIDADSGVCAVLVFLEQDP